MGKVQWASTPGGVVSRSDRWVGEVSLQDGLWELRIVRSYDSRLEAFESLAVALETNLRSDGGEAKEHKRLNCIPEGAFVLVWVLEVGLVCGYRYDVGSSVILRDARTVGVWQGSVFDVAAKGFDTADVSKSASDVFIPEHSIASVFVCSPESEANYKEYVAQLTKSGTKKEG